jgi:hypothetical protein
MSDSNGVVARSVKKRTLSGATINLPDFARLHAIEQERLLPSLWYGVSV